MPAQEQSHRFQTAVLWERTGYGDDGQPTLGAPAELSVRWVVRTQQIRDKTGNLINIVATAVVDREIPVGSAMWLGELDNWYGTGSAGNDDNLMEVLFSSVVPDVKNREIIYKARLAYYRGEF